MYRIVLSIMILFSKEEYRWWRSNLEFTGLRIPSTATISTYRMFAIFCSQSNFCINRSVTSIVLSFKGNTNTKYYHIISIGSSIDCNPKPNIILSHFSNVSLNYELFTLLFFCSIIFFLWLVPLLNPIPYQNMIPLNKLRQPLRCLSQWQTWNI